MIEIYDLLFVIVALFTISTAIMTLKSKEIVYGAVSLGLMFLGIAGLYVLLDATYVAMFQISVYIGAVVVIILFTIMVVPREQWIKKTPEIIKSERLAGTISAGVLVCLIAYIYFSAGSSVLVSPVTTIVSIQELAIRLFSDYGIALIILAITLAAALIGAIILVKVDWRV